MRGGLSVPVGAANAAPAASLATRLLLALGAAGSLLFTATWLIEGVTRPRYDAWQQAISALSLGPDGWVQQVNFVVFGAAMGCSAIGWRAALAPGAGAVAIPALKCVTALALIADGLFSQDPARGFPPGTPPPAAPTLHGTIHVLGAFVAVLTLAAACVAFTARFAREPAWRAWAPLALAAGVLTIVFIAAFGATLGRGPAGLFERLMSGTESVFNTLVVARLLLGAGLVSTTG